MSDPSFGAAALGAMALVIGVICEGYRMGCDPPASGYRLPRDPARGSSGYRPTLPTVGSVLSQPHADSRSICRKI